MLLFGDTPADRANETGASERTLLYKADRFDQHGMLSLFPTEPDLPDETARSLPPSMRQASVELHAEHPALTQPGSTEPIRLLVGNDQR